MIQPPASELLGPHGPFAEVLPGFAPRAPQQLMADAVAQAMADYTRLVIEAGTGVGKTYAYLVPALRSGGRVIISTGTRNLQDQLFHRDLPTVARTLRLPLRAALLKGRSNYLCLYRIQGLISSGERHTREIQGQLHKIGRWSSLTRSGDIAELPGIPVDSPLWPRVTSTVDNCLGTECDRYRDCFVVKARRAAQEAELVVINHHLLMADVVLKEDGFGELLPSANAMVIDEAHQLPEVAADYFGQSMSSRQLQDLSIDTLAALVSEAPDMVEPREAIDELRRASADLRIALGPEISRVAWAALADQPEVEESFTLLEQRLEVLHLQLQTIAERGKALESCAGRAGDLLTRLRHFAQGQAEVVRWVECRGAKSFILHQTPLDVGPSFQRHLDARRCAWVFTSATLAVGERFDHFASRLGLVDYDPVRLDSPFDYQTRALLYLPDRLPDPNHPRYTAAVIESALPLLQASRGRAFMLFTSHRALRQSAEALVGQLPYPLLVQGDSPQNELIEQFRELGNAILLGTQSFWEGVDVRGGALSCVIIDRLPFASPGDPVVKARLNYLEASGQQPFRDYQLPQAVITLKQGVGRLIRDPQDRGVLALLDPRLRNRPYGKLFLNSLPPMRHTAELSEVRRFFDEEPQ